LKDWGMQMLIGTTTSTPCVAVVEETHADNMFQLTPSATAVESIQYDNAFRMRSEEHTSELQSRFDLVCRLLLEKKKLIHIYNRSVVAHEEGTGHLQVEIRLEYREFPDHYLLEADLLAVAVRDPSGRAWAVAVQF